MATVALVENVEMWVAGNLVRVRVTSGGEDHSYAVPITMFMQQAHIAACIVTEWDASKGKVVPFPKAKAKP